MNSAVPITVSVLIPSLNHGPYLKACIDSVISQDYPGIEVIVIDDGSTDNSIEILRDYGDQITLLQQSRGRQARARNLGLELAKGEYIAFLDSDDRYLPGRIRSSIEAFIENPEADVVWGDFRLIDSKNRVLSTCCWKPHMPDFRFELVSGNPICNATATVRKRVIVSIGGFDERLSRTCDGLAWYQIAAKGGRFVHLDHILVEYRLHDSNDSNNFKIMSRERDTALLTAVQAYIDCGVVSSHKELLWLRNAVVKQFAFRTAAYIQSVISHAPLSRVKTAFFNSIDSDSLYCLIIYLRKFKIMLRKIFK